MFASRTVVSLLRPWTRPKGVLHLSPEQLSCHVFLLRCLWCLHSVVKSMSQQSQLPTLKNNQFSFIARTKSQDIWKKQVFESAIRPTCLLALVCHRHTAAILCLTTVANLLPAILEITKFVNSKIWQFSAFVWMTQAAQTPTHRLAKFLPNLLINLLDSKGLSQSEFVHYEDPENVALQAFCNILKTSSMASPQFFS